MPVVSALLMKYKQVLVAQEAIIGVLRHRALFLI
uniref:Alanineglyoxylate aminotransferase 2 homolog 1-like n=1 Tax=Rhizophora mucronata TaxID=61149 RepID=A0A2P2JEB2_RHIMU